MRNASNTPGAQRSQRLSRVRSLAHVATFWLLPSLVWFVSCFYFLGDLGRIGDDWSLDLRRADASPLAPASALAQTDAVIGGPSAPVRYHWPESPFARWNYFWRPAHLVLIHALATFAWDAHWLRHGLNAVLHACCAALLYRFLRRFNIRRGVAGVAALVMLSHPATYEAALWPSTVSTLIGVALMLLAWTRAADIGSGRHQLPSGTARRALVPVAWGAFTFVVACFYEQPAGAIVLAGVLALPPGAWKPRRVSLGRVALIAVGPIAACAIYIALLVATAPSEVRGGSSTFKSPGDIAASLWACTRHALDWIAGPNLFETTRAAAGVGFDQLHADGWLWPVLAVFVVASVAWLVNSAAQPLPRSERSASTPRCTDAWLALTLLGGFVCALVPTAATSDLLPQPRLLYLPLLCVVGLAALVVDRAVIRLQIALSAEATSRQATTRTLLWRAPLAILALACIAAFALAMLGFQTHYRARARADADQVAQLVRLVPDPPPGAVFMPVAAEYQPFSTGVRGFDRAFPSAITLPWASWAWVQCADGYRRRDLFCTHLRLGGKRGDVAMSYSNATLEESNDGTSPLGRGGFAYRPRWATPPPWVRRGGQWIEWDRCIPFSVGVDGRVRLVHTVRITSDRASTSSAANNASAELIVRLPLVQPLRASLEDDDCVEASLRVVGSTQRSN